MLLSPDFVPLISSRVPSWVLPGASLDLYFAASLYYGITPSGLTVVRNSVGYIDDTSGNWAAIAANLPRISNKGLLAEEARTNSIRNNSMQGAVVGSPGTVPTNWSIGGANGLTFTVTALPTTNGVECVRIRITGTPTAAGTTSALNFESTTQIAAVNGQVWTHGLFAAIVSGTQTNIASLGMVARLRDSGGISLSSGTSASITSATSTLARFSVTQTLANASVAFLQPGLNLVNTDNTTPIDITIDVGWPQLELGAFVTSPIRTTAAAATRAADSVQLANPPVFGGAFSSFVDALLTDLSQTRFLVASTNTNRLIYTASSNTQASLYNGTNILAATAGSGGFTTGAKVASAFDGSGRSIVMNGGTAGTDANTQSAPASIYLGSANGVSPAGVIYFRRVALWPNTRLPNATLQAMTA